MRILLCSFGSPGFLFPLVGLARELAERGHQVAFVSGQDSIPVLSAAMFERIPRGVSDGESFTVARWGSPLSTAIDVKHIEYAIGQFAPDVLVSHQLCQSAVIVRERTQIPLAILGFAAYLWPPSAATPITDEDRTRREWRWRDGIRLLNEARHLFNLDDIHPTAESFPLLGDLFMLRSVPELEAAFSPPPPELSYVGACEWEPVDASHVQWSEIAESHLRRDCPLIYVHQGRTFDSPSFWPQLLDAFANKPVRLVCSVGRMDTDVGHIPENFFIRPHIGQGAVLPHASAVIAGGHSTVTLGALSHGLPCLLLPAGGETLDNAARLSAAGSALVLSPESPPEDIRVALEQILDVPSYRENASRLRAAFNRFPRFTRPANLIEQLGMQDVPTV